MPAYLRSILASACARGILWIRGLAAHPAVHWVGLVAGYGAVFAGYIAILIALFTPDLAVVVARIMLVAAVLAGVVALAVIFGRLVNRRASLTEAAQR